MTPRKVGGRSRYVVGYAGSLECVYGKGDNRTAAHFVEKLTFKQAKKRLGFLQSRYRSVIYKLVPVFARVPRK